MKLLTIKQQLNWLILKITLYSFIISFGTYFIWVMITTLRTGHPVGDDLTFDTADWMQVIVSTLLTVVVSVLTAAGFARKILFSLNSLTVSARRVADGDLSVRAQQDAKPLAEMSALVDDFNQMAEKLENASRDIRTWNAAIAHELRTPVTILRGRLQGLADGIFAPEQQLFLNLVKQTDGLSHLIDDLRTLSLAQSGHLRLQYGVINVPQEIEAIAAVVEADFKVSQHSLVLRLNDAMIPCDAARLRQALLALLENARRYAVSGVVMISCREQQDGVVITVEDEGPGVSAEVVATIWDAFVRGDDSRSRHSGGTGLGLAVVRAIIVAHGGEVKYDSGELNGTRFSLWLPYAADIGQKEAR
ncbi:HAMP domain-containing protein [Erwinia sp. S63]|uniref:ATP-binding protein n=1 Tax=Erwinia sp. S63 TaxID=2769341 RepID=UPI00190BD6F5|nr:ATP-binding protein [Erwinia sp. S63]MBK0097300.1 HAMP domain-containing protein [Erwinia sp. S63]